MFSASTYRCACAAGRTRRRFAVGVTAWTIALGAMAQGTPSVIKVVVPFSAGGISDTMARAVVERMSRALGQTMLIENKPGGGTRIGTDLVARAPADGATVLFTNATYSIVPIVDPTANYDPTRALAPVGLAGTYGLPIVVSTKLPANNLKEFVEYARKNPGKLSYGSSGQGSGTHFAGEYFKLLTRTHMVHIPYKSTSAASADVASGVLDVAFDASAKPYADAGKVKILAVAADQRDPRMPNVPTTAEAGLKEFVANSWVGMLAPAGTPAQTIERLNQALATALTDPALCKIMADQGVNPAGGPSARMSTVIASDVTLYRKIVKEANVKIE